MPDNGAQSPVNAASTPTTGQGSAAGQPAIDVEKLADKVYALLLAETRVGRARSNGLRLGRGAEE